MACVKASSRSWSEETIRTSWLPGDCTSPIFEVPLTTSSSVAAPGRGTFAGEPEDVCKCLPCKPWIYRPAFVTPCMATTFQRRDLVRTRGGWHGMTVTAVRPVCTKATGLYLFCVNTATAFNGGVSAHRLPLSHPMPRPISFATWSRLRISKLTASSSGASRKYGFAKGRFPLPCTGTATM